MQVLLSYMMVYTVNTTLENRKVTFHGVGADKHIALFASVNLPAMSNRTVTAEIFLQPLGTPDDHPS
jgi:hypothetical protein